MHANYFELIHVSGKKSYLRKMSNKAIHGKIKIKKEVGSDCLDLFLVNDFSEVFAAAIVESYS